MFAPAAGIRIPRPRPSVTTCSVSLSALPPARARTALTAVAGFLISITIWWIYTTYLVWMLGGLSLHRFAVGRLPTLRIPVALAGVISVLAVPLTVSRPGLLLWLDAAILVGYATTGRTRARFSRTLPRYWPSDHVSRGVPVAVDTGNAPSPGGPVSADHPRALEPKGTIT
jgi:hypothetical protein